MSPIGARDGEHVRLVQAFGRAASLACKENRKPPRVLCCLTRIWDGMAELKNLMSQVYGALSTAEDIDSVVDRYFAVDFVEHDSIPGVDVTGRDLVKVMFGMMKAGMPDIHVEVDMMVEEGNKVAALGAFVGTFSGEVMGVVGHGQQVRLPFADLIEWRDGTIVAHWGVSDMSALVAPV